MMIRVRAHSRRSPSLLAGRGREAGGFSFGAALAEAWRRAKEREELSARIERADERARRAVSADVREATAEEARRLRRERLCSAARDYCDAPGDLPARLDAFAASADDAAIDQLTAVLTAAVINPTEGGQS